MFRRLRRIELQLTPKGNVASQQAAQLIWERRRRRALASGVLFDETAAVHGTSASGWIPLGCGDAPPSPPTERERAGVRIEIASDITT